MGASSAAKEDMDLDLDDDEFLDSSSIHDLDEGSLRSFCKKAAMSFFDEYGLISHQINSYNDFIKNSLQKIFDSFGEIVVEPGYDPSKKGESEWRYASVRFGKVNLDKPSFWGGESGDGNGKEYNMLPRHARLQNMTYSSRMKVNIHVQVNTIKLVQFCPFHSDKCLAFGLML